VEQLEQGKSVADVLKDFDALKILLWVVPGAFIALFRSFAMRGTFPTIGKDDVAAFALGSVIYYFVILLFTSRVGFGAAPAQSGWVSFIVLILVPAIAGMLLGLLEASDAIGRFLRKVGIRLPSPDATAWETLFREVPTNAVLLVTLKDGNTVAGRWIGGRGGSASSSDAKIMDLYLGQIGAINHHGQYVPHSPQRGAYFAASEIRFIEVIAT
jgi:Family of unknown function (DUF6338)